MPSVKNSTKIVFDQYYREEDRHFRESLSEEEKKNTQLFIRKLKEHVLYHLVVMNYKKRSLINKWLLEYVEENCDKEEEPEPEPCEKKTVKVTTIKLNGVIYYRSADNVLFDTKTKQAIGFWCPDRKAIVLLDEEEEAEEAEAEDSKSKLGYFCGDIYGCVDGECKSCFRCNPIYYFGIKRSPPLMNKVQEELESIIKYNDKNSNAYINAYNMKLIDHNYNLLI
jgi:hypothetical protein